MDDIPQIVGGCSFPTQLGDVIFSALNGLPEDAYKHGRTAAYWHIMAVLEQHMKENHNA